MAAGAPHIMAFLTGAAMAGLLVALVMTLWGRSLRAQAQRHMSELQASLQKQAEQARVLERAQLEASTRARQQAAIASLGQRALAGIDVELLIGQAVSVVCDTLGVAAAGVFEAVQSDGSLLLRAGHGWRDAHVGLTRLAGDTSVYPGYVMTAEAAVVPSGWMDPLFSREMLTTGAAVRIPGLPTPYGLLLVADRSDRSFSRDDLHFLHAVANVIGAALERAAVERELRAALAVNHATLEAAAEGIYVTDAEGRVTRHNERLVDMLRIPPDVIGTGDPQQWMMWTAQFAEDPALLVANFKAALVSDTVHSAVITMKDGRVFERHSQPQRVDGRIIGRVWCFRDLTERVRAEEERRRLEAHMQHVQKLESLGVLAGGIAHDFNNLLVGILGNAGLAMMEAASDSPLVERLKQIETAAQRAADLTNQMLAYSGKGRFVVQRVDLSELVDETANLLRTAISKNAELKITLERALPAFEGDAGQIRQVVMNLITNASDAIGDKPGHIEVRTGSCTATRDYLTDAVVGSDRAEGEFVFAEVRDNGCGMDAATMERIFDPFFTTKFTGRGLGLAAVLGIVRGHGGAIKITSTVGGGTTFRVLLPAAQAAPRVAVAAQTKPGRPVAGRVLVVDDEPSVRRVASEVLARAGFEVQTANDGEEAVEIVRQRGADFQAVLLDMTMPKMNGAQALKAMRGLAPDVGIVITSGYSEQDTTARFGVDGLAGFVQKPFLPATLVAAIRAAVDRSLPAPVSEPSR